MRPADSLDVFVVEPRETEGAPPGAVAHSDAPQEPLLDAPIMLREVNVDRGDDNAKIGLGLRTMGSRTLEVTEVTEGLIAQWNASQQPSARVAEGDRILEVNGLTECAVAMYDAMLTQRRLSIIVERTVAVT